MAKKVEVELIIDKNGAVTAVKTADGELLKLRDTTDKVDRSTKRLSTSMKVGLAAALVGVASLARKGFQELNQSVQLAGVQQIAEAKLEQALRNTGDASEESAAMLKGLAAETQRFSNFGDEAIITAQAMLLSFAQVGGAQGAALLTPRLADVAAGVAKVTGQTVDLNTVSAALGKALAQGAGSLKEYGISLSKAQEEQFNTLEGMEKVRLLTEILDSNFGGLAEVTRDPFVAAENAVNDLREQLGLAVRGEMTQFAAKTEELAQDPNTVAFVQQTGVAIATVIRKGIELFGFLGDISAGVRASIRFMVAQFRTGQIVINSATSSIKGGLATLADAVGLDGLAGKIRESKRETDINTLALQTMLKGEFELMNQILNGSTPAIEAKTTATRNLTTATNEANAATERHVQLQARSIDVKLPEDVLIGISLDDIPEITEESADTVALLISQMLGLGESIDIVTEKTKESEEATKGAQASFTNYTTGAITDLNSLRGAVIGFMLAFIQAKINEAIVGAAAKEFSTKGLLGGITAALAVGVIKGFISKHLNVPAFAGGVSGFGGGMALVGERGPELVTMGRGSNVITNENTERVLRRLESASISPAGGAVANDLSHVITTELRALGDRMQHIEARIDPFHFKDEMGKFSRQQSAIGNTAPLSK